jgi:hypothetical protein
METVAALAATPVLAERPSLLACAVMRLENSDPARCHCPRERMRRQPGLRFTAAALPRSIAIS